MRATLMKRRKILQKIIKQRQNREIHRIKRGITLTQFGQMLKESKERTCRICFFRERYFRKMNVLANLFP